MDPQELQAQLEQTQAQLQIAQTVIRDIESSNLWQLRTAWFKLKQILRLRRFLPHRAISPQLYAQWQQKHLPRPSDLQRMAETLEIFPLQPLISILFQVENSASEHLQASITSVLQQIYPHWELCIADDGVTQSHLQPILAETIAHPDQIKIIPCSTADPMSTRLNAALSLTSGDFVLCLTQDDILTPDALYEVVLLLNRYPTADLIYSDHDKIDASGQLSAPYFKPDWCPDSLLSRMYLGNLVAYRRSRLHAIQGFKTDYADNHHYDLALRFTETTTQIFHIPKILYHQRIEAESPTSMTAGPDTIAAANRAISDALARRNEPGHVISSKAGYHQVRYTIQTHHRVTIIIPTRDFGDVLARCLASIFEKTDYPDYEVLVIDNGSTEARALAVIQQWQTQEPQRFRCEILDIPFNYSKINNYAVQQATGHYLLFLNNDTEIRTSDWLSSLVEQGQRPSIGAVGALLLYPDDTIQHAGVILGIGGNAGHSHKHFPATADGYFGQIQTVNNYSSVTAACLLCRREVFEQVGGFTEELAVALNDVDLCLKMIAAGYRNVYLPHVALYHYESKSRGHDNLTTAKLARSLAEKAYMRKTWGKLMDCDPCYNPNLTLTLENYDLNLS